MTDRHACADGQREVGVAVADRAVLDVGFLADHDRSVVAPDHRSEPDTCTRAEPNIADEVGRGRRPGAVLQLRCDAADAVKWHGPPLSRLPLQAKKRPGGAWCTTGPHLLRVEFRSRRSATPRRCAASR